MVPTTLGELNGMAVAELDSLFQFYAIPTQGTGEDKLRALCDHLCVSLTVVK